LTNRKVPSLRGGPWSQVTVSLVSWRFARVADLVNEAAN